MLILLNNLLDNIVVHLFSVKNDMNHCAAMLK